VELLLTPNNLDVDYRTLNVVTNSPTGYDLMIKAKDGQVNLVCDYDNDYVVAPGDFSSASNRWGYGVGDSQPSVWSGVTTGDVSLFSSLPVATSSDGEDTRVWFGAMVDYETPACEYSGGVTFTAVVTVDGV
jgi:hypothetical protein